MMINRIVVLAAFGALVMALVACAASESEYEQTAESEVMEYRSADATYGRCCARASAATVRDGAAGRLQHNRGQRDSK